LGGVARNVAHNLARLDVGVALISAVGNDDFGRDLLARTEAAGVDISMVIQMYEPTGSYVAVLDPDGEMTVAVNAMAAVDGLTPDRLAVHESSLRDAKLLFADSNLPRESGWLARFGDKLIVDPVSVAKAGRLRALQGERIYAVVLNRLQMQELCGLKIGNRDEAVAAVEDLHRHGFARVILTLAADGAVVSESDSNPLHVEAFAGSSHDVTGGGDAATAALIFGLLRGFDLVEAAGLGQAAASLAISGADTVPADLSSGRLLSLLAARKSAS
jgi:pseudouridine kinase